MGYDSDYYTTRRTYSRPIVTSYTYTPPPRKSDIPWEKVPFVPRPTLVADPITVFGKTRSVNREKKISYVDKLKQENIKPSEDVLAQPVKPYISPRDRTRHKVLSLTRRSAADRQLEHEAMLEIQRIEEAEIEKPCKTRQTPRYRVETIEEPRRRANEYSYSYSSSSQQRTSSGDPYSRPERQASSTTVERSTRYGPGGDYSYSSSRATTGSGPGGYSYSSTSSGRLPYGTTYRNYSYRV